MTTQRTLADSLGAFSPMVKGAGANLLLLIGNSFLLIIELTSSRRGARVESRTLLTTILAVTSYYFLAEYNAADRVSTAADDDATTSVICSGLIIVWYASIAENPATIIDSIKLTAKIAIISLRFIVTSFLFTV